MRIDIPHRLRHRLGDVALQNIAYAEGGLRENRKNRAFGREKEIHESDVNLQRRLDIGLRVARATDVAPELVEKAKYEGHYWNDWVKRANGER